MFWNSHLLGPRRDATPGAGGGTGGTGQPGGSTQNPGTGSNNIDPSQYLSKEEFGRTAALISGIQKTIKDMTGALLTTERLVELGLLEKAEDGTFKPRSAAAADPGKKGNGAGEAEPWKKELEAMKRQLAEKDQAIESEKKARQESDRNRAIIAALSKGGAVNADRDFVHLAGKVVAGPDGASFVVKGQDKYGAEIDIPLEQFAADWLNANPELKKAQAATGSGAAGGTGHSGKPGEKPLHEMSMDEYLEWRKTNLKSKL